MDKAKSTVPKARELYLDFVRGIAILLAMGWHFNSQKTGYWIIDLFLMPGHSIGWAGVDLFFVLSGFLIGRLIFNEYIETGYFRPGRFLIRRAFKIYPILYTYLVLLLVTGRYSWETFFFQNVFHVQNYFLTPLAHLWSLAVEEHFYIIFAVAFMQFCKSRPKKFNNLNFFAISLPLILLICPLLRSLAYYYSLKPHTIQVQTQFRADALAFGICLAYLNLFYKNKFEYISRQKFLLFILFLGGSVALAIFQHHPWFRVTVGYSLSYLSGGALLLYCYNLRFINNKNYFVAAIAWIGFYSYAMYVYQFVMMRVVEAVLKKINIDAIPATLDLFIKYAGAIGLAFVLTTLIERPSLKLREKLFPSNSSVSPVVK